VIVVEPEQAACLCASACAGELHPVDIGEETIMAGLSCGEPSALAWAILREEASDFLTIPDSLIGPAMRMLARPVTNDPSIEAGESGVAGLAASIAIASNPGLRSACGFDSESRVLLIGSEGVTDPAIYAQIMAG
jgi:diaminopropionate ammonia-lyase